jgi:putative endonuclease
MNTYYVYILASRPNGTLYVGVTNELLKRVGQHKNDMVEGFTQRHKVHILVYFEATSDVQAAIAREKQLKRWRREWKLRLIED